MYAFVENTGLWHLPKMSSASKIWLAAIDVKVLVAYKCETLPESIHKKLTEIYI